MTEQATLQKRYVADNGILNLFLFQGETKLLENMVEELGLFGIPRRYQHPLDHGNFVVCQAWYWQQRIQKAYISSML